MRYEEALIQFLNEIEKEYGLRDQIVRITVKPALFDTIVDVLAKDYIYNYGSDQLSNVKICGVEFEAKA